MKWGCLIVLVSIATILCGCTKQPLPPSPPPDTTPPPAITGLVATDAYNGKVVLSWGQSTAEDFDHYNVYLSTEEITDVTSMTPVHRITDITINSYLVTGLKDGTKYYFAVTAVDKSGNEGSLVTITSATPVTIPPSSLDTTPPETTITSAPSETIDSSDVSFQWTGSDYSTTTAELVYSYKLEGHDAEYSPFTPDKDKTYVNLPDGSYIFYVKALDKAGNVDPTPATSRFTIVTAIPAGLLLLRNSEVNRIAVGSDDKTIYALDSVNTRLYKSSYSGYGWVDISAGLTGVAAWNELAIAPDAPEIVAVVTSARTEVYLSSNGDAFFSMGLAPNLAAGELIQCIAISPGYGGSAREVAVGTSTGNGGGRVWVNALPISGWMDVSTGAAGWLPALPPIVGTDVFAIKYSPAFAIDKAILAIVSSGPPPDTDDTYLYIGKRGVAGATAWNGNVLPGYPVEICQPGGDSPGSPFTYADLALPSDYIASDMSSQRLYASWSDNLPGTAIAGNPNDDVYRLDDTLCNRLYVGGGSPESVISSLAYYGTSNEGKLLAGAMMGAPGSFSVPVYFTSNPQSGFPTWQSSLKPPTGPNEAQVAWSPDGSVAYCGTSTIGGASGDQSAFSRSTNDGLSWNQTGLIDT
jgi:hypothetical protein